MTTRYSKAAAMQTLRDWSAKVDKHGFFVNFNFGENYGAASIDRGMIDAANDLADRLAAIPGKVLRKDFKDIVVSSRDENMTLPVNVHHFTNRNGCDQITSKGVKSAYAYGKFNFHTDVVFSLFPDLDW